MVEEIRPEDIRKKTVVHRIEGMDSALVRRDVPFRGADGSALAMDLYRPAGTEPGEPLPAGTPRGRVPRRGISVPDRMRLQGHGLGHVLGPTPRGLGTRRRRRRQSRSRGRRARDARARPGKRRVARHRRNATRRLGGLRKRPGRVEPSDGELRSSGPMRHALVRLHARLRRRDARRRCLPAVRVRQRVRGPIGGRDPEGDGSLSCEGRPGRVPRLEREPRPLRRGGPGPQSLAHARESRRRGARLRPLRGWRAFAAGRPAGARLSPFPPRFGRVAYRGDLPPSVAAESTARR